MKAALRARTAPGDTGTPDAPLSPESLAEAGLSLGFVNDMILRTLYTQGAMLGRDLAQYLCLPFKVIFPALRFLKDEKCIQVEGGDLVGEVSYRFTLTDLGRYRAQEAMKFCAYVGPAPVPLEDYVEQTYRQAVTGINCYPEALYPAFSH
ncbi:MAG TPA: ATPase, partial [Gemmataceae bacterium]